MKNKKRKRRPNDTWTLSGGAQLLRMDRRTLEKRLTSAGYTGPKYSTQELVDATWGEAARIAEREAAANASMAELKAKAMTEELVDFAAVQKIIGEIWLAYRQRLLALPAEACAQCNPADPAFANAALQTWADQALTMLRAEVTAAEVRAQKS